MPKDDKAPDTKHQQVADDQRPQPGTGTDLSVVDFGEDAGVGMENVDQSEFKIPFVRILDAKSPQVKPANMGGVPGAVAGMFINIATGEVFKELLFMPVHRDHYYVEYIKKNDDGSGGGFVGIRDVDDPLVLRLLAQQGKFKKLVTTDEPPHEIVETFELKSIVMGAKTDEKTHITERDGPAFCANLSFSSTQIPKYQTLITRYNAITYMGADNTPTKPPLWAHMWHATSQYETKKTRSWFGWVLRLWRKKPDGTELPTRESLVKRTDPLYIMAKEFYASIAAGKVKSDYKQAADLAADDGPIPFEP